MINRQRLKSETKMLFKENGFRVFLVATVFLVLTLVLTLLITRLSGYYDYYMKIVDIYTSVFTTADITQDELTEYQNQLSALDWPRITAMAGILCAAAGVMLIMVQAGFTGYCLALSRREQTSFKTLFESFNYFGKVLGIYLLRGIITIMGLFVFVFPGIVLFYCYRQAVFVMYSDPSLSVTQCLRRSREMMSGRKSELFVLDLSFIGWYILSEFFALSGLPLADIWVRPYTGVTYAVYFNHITGFVPAPPENGGMPPV